MEVLLQCRDGVDVIQIERSLRVCVCVSEIIEDDRDHHRDRIIEMRWALQQLLDRSRTCLLFNVVPQALVMRDAVLLCVCVCARAGVLLGGWHDAASPLFCCTLGGVAVVPSALSIAAGRRRPPLKRRRRRKTGSGGVGGRVGRGSRGGRRGSGGKYSVLCSCLCG